MAGEARRGARAAPTTVAVLRAALACVALACVAGGCWIGTIPRTQHGHLDGDYWKQPMTPALPHARAAKASGPMVIVARPAFASGQPIGGLYELCGKGSYEWGGTTPVKQTYALPTVHYELAEAVARALRQRGLRALLDYRSTKASPPRRLLAWRPLALELTVLRFQHDHVKPDDAKAPPFEMLGVVVLARLTRHSAGGAARVVLQRKLTLYRKRPVLERGRELLTELSRQLVGRLLASGALRVGGAS